MKRECGDWQLLEDVTGLAAGIMTAFSYMETFMEEFPEFPERETVLDFYFCLRDFLNVYEELDGHYRTGRRVAENRMVLAPWSMHLERSREGSTQKRRTRKEPSSRFSS